MRTNNTHFATHSGHIRPFFLMFQIAYNVKAKIIHNGSRCNSGHYTAAVKRDSQWFIVDDNNVSQVIFS